MDAPHRRSPLPAVLLVAGLSLLGASANDDDTRGRAISLYDQQLYFEALPLLERLRSEGKAGGDVLYRLAFAQLSTGAREAAARTLLEAESALKAEMAEGPDVESAFYLTNIYRQSQRPDDAREIARTTTSLVESGKLDPGTGLSAFQLAELYGEVGNTDAAALWYERALDGLLEDNVHPAYVDRAGRLLAERAWNTGDWEKAAKYYGVVVDNGGATIANFDRLATALARTGQYREAAKAWHGAELLNPAEGNRPRYLMRVANLAVGVGALPETAPAGTPWSQMGKTELAELMKQQAGIVAEVVEQARAEGTLTRERRAELQGRIDAAKPVFIAAALHYGMAGYGLRETAFFGGYAQLIFRQREWTVPYPKPARRRGKPQPDAEQP